MPACTVLFAASNNHKQRQQSGIAAAAAANWRSFMEIILAISIPHKFHPNPNPSRPLVRCRPADVRVVKGYNAEHICGPGPHFTHVPWSPMKFVFQYISLLTVV